MLQELGEGVFRLNYESLHLNIGVVLGADGVLLIDTRSSQVEARELREDVRRLTSLPVRWVVNTHWHWDHAFGNSVFGGADLWGHRLCRVGLENHGEEMIGRAGEYFPDRVEEFKAVEIVPPDHLFEDTATLDLGNRLVRLSYHGVAHTDADIIVDLPDDDVVFMGDLVEEGAPPAFGDSYPLAWPGTLRQGFPARTSVVPGHGSTVNADFVTGQAEELDAVASLAAAVVAGELSAEEAASGGPYPAAVMQTAFGRALEVAA